MSALLDHGVDRFDLSAPDRVPYMKVVDDVEVQDSKNVLMRWTFRDSDGRRSNTPRGAQCASNLTAEAVITEMDRSLPTILRDFAGPKRAGVPTETLGRDVYWRAHADSEWRVILLDDVDIASLPNCRRLVWQTSANSYQAFLFLDTALDKHGRYLLQHHFAHKLGISDGGATSGDRFGRPLRSVNRKPGRDSFETRLHEVGLDLPLLIVADVMEETRRLAATGETAGYDEGLHAARHRGDGSGDVDAVASMSPPSRLLGRRPPPIGSQVRSDFTPSGDDMAVAMSKHRRGCSDHEVHAWLAQIAHSRGKFDPEGYARRTLSKAKATVASGGVLPPAKRRKSGASS